MNRRQINKAAAASIAARSDYQEEVNWLGGSVPARRHFKRTATRAARRAARAELRDARR